MDLDLEGRDELMRAGRRVEAASPQWISTWRVETSVVAAELTVADPVAAMDLDLEGRDEAPGDPTRFVSRRHAAMDLDLEGRDEALRRPAYPLFLGPQWISTWRVETS